MDKVFALLGGLFSGVKKIPSGVKGLLDLIPDLFGRAIQALMIYVTSYFIEKILDILHERFPNNEVLANAATVAHGIVSAENLLVKGATSLGKTAYNALSPAEAAPSQPLQTHPSSNPTPDLTKTGVEIPPVSASSLLPAPPTPSALSSALPHAIETTREAAFMPMEPEARNRANLNTAITQPATSAPPPSNPVLGPDNMPINGGYDPETGVTWQPYMDTYHGPKTPHPRGFKP